MWDVDGIVVTLRPLGDGQMVRGNENSGSKWVLTGPIHHGTSGRKAKYCMRKALELL